MSEDASGDALPYHGTRACVLVRARALVRVHARALASENRKSAVASAAASASSSARTHVSVAACCMSHVACRMSHVTCIHSPPSTHLRFLSFALHARTHTHAHAYRRKHALEHAMDCVYTRACDTDTLDIAGTVTGGLLYDNFWSGYYGTR